MGNIQTVGPNEALVVSGGCCRPARRQIIVGGWCWSTWMLTNVQRISLQIMTVTPKCEKVQSCHGVPVSVNAVVHCKIMSTPDSLPLAAEQFLGKAREDIERVVLHTIEGHMRAVIGTQTIEDICKKRHELANLIREAAHKDLFNMGIDIMSLTLKEIKDEVQYLSSAGMKSTAAVKRDAAVSVAKADNEAAQVVEECKRSQEDCEQQNKTKLAELNHKMQMEQATLRESVSELTAEAQKAYDMQLALMQKEIRELQLQVEAQSFDGQIKIRNKDTERRKIELEMEYELPTKSKIYELKKQSEAYEAKLKCETEAEEFKIREAGEARAIAFRLVGDAEANGLKLLAEARKNFNDAAVLAETIKILPEIAAEIASPLTKFEEIVLISDKGQVNEFQSTDKSSKLYPSNAAETAKRIATNTTAIKAVGGDSKLSGNLINSIMKLQRAGA